jgi:rhodanese-related sulfurtransferase
MRTLTALELKHMRDRGEDFVLINTLPADMYASTKIPGSVNIAEKDGDFADRVLQKTGDAEKTVVVYCMNDHCDSAENAGKKLEAAGFHDVRHFAGGAEGWKAFSGAKSSAFRGQGV